MNAELANSAHPTVDQRLRSMWPEIQGYGVKHLWIFGSRARGQAGESSDCDLLVEFEQPPGFDAFMTLKLMLEDSLGMPVDLLSLHACPPRWLRAIQPEMLRVA
jgi:predicted nucleotidyltransferase